MRKIFVVFAVGFAGCQPGSVTPGLVSTDNDAGTPVCNATCVGQTGPAGTPGIAGNNGTNGISVTGTSVGPNSTCANGGVLLTSANGTNYVCNGENGQSGASGPQGISGPPGQNGLNGAVGPAGPTGATGPQGIQGVAGQNGVCTGTCSSSSGGSGGYTLISAYSSSFSTIPVSVTCTSADQFPYADAVSFIGGGPNHTFAIQVSFSGNYVSSSITVNGVVGLVLDGDKTNANMPGEATFAQPVLLQAADGSTNQGLYLSQTWTGLVDSSGWPGNPDGSGKHRLEVYVDIGALTPNECGQTDQVSVSGNLQYLLFQT